jgi:hypothetical protein
LIGAPTIFDREYPMAVDSINASGDFRIGAVLHRAGRILVGNVVFFLAVPVVATLIMIALSYGFRTALTTAIRVIRPAWIAQLAISLGFLFVILCLAMIGQSILLVAAFQRLRGHPLRAGEAIRRALGRILPLLGLGIIWFAVFLLIGILSIFIVSRLEASLALSLWFTLPLILMPMSMLAVIWAVSAPACVVEGLGPIGSMIRSAGLTKGYRWRVFGIILLLVAVFAAGVVVQLLTASWIGQGSANILGWIWPIPWAAYSGCAVAMTYHDLRLVKEGVDVAQTAAIFD